MHSSHCLIVNSMSWLSPPAERIFFFSPSFISSGNSDTKTDDEWPCHLIRHSNFAKRRRNCKLSSRLSLIVEWPCDGCSLGWWLPSQGQLRCQGHQLHKSPVAPITPEALLMLHHFIHSRSQFFRSNICILNLHGGGRN